MKPTERGTATTRPRLGGCTLRDSGASLISERVQAIVDPPTKKAEEPGRY